MTGTNSAWPGGRWPDYPGGMPKARPTPDPNAGKGLERVVRVGMDLVRQARDAAKSAGGVSVREQRMAQAHRAAVTQHESEVRGYRARIAAAKAGVVVGGGSTVVLGAATAASLAQSSGAAILFGGLAASGAALGWTSRQRGKDLKAHPPIARIPPPPPARLRPGARGADQADRVAEALLHLYDLVPSVGRLYPAAGQDLWRTVSQVEPLLRGQVERLTSLDRLEWSMPGSRPAEAAQAASIEITGRLRSGADALEDLMVAAARMLSAPDIGEGVSDVLAPAIDSLDAYAHGLNAANAARLGGPSPY